MKKILLLGLLTLASLGALIGCASDETRTTTTTTTTEETVIHDPKAM